MQTVEPGNHIVRKTTLPRKFLMISQIIMKKKNTRTHESELLFSEQKQSITSTPVTPKAVSKFGVILNGTFSGTLSPFPFSKHTL